MEGTTVIPVCEGEYRDLCIYVLVEQKDGTYKCPLCMKKSTGPVDGFKLEGADNNDTRR